MKILLAGILAFLIAESAMGQCSTLSYESRKCFDNSNAPPSVVFDILLGNVAVDSIDYWDDMNRLPDEEGHPGWHMIKDGLTDNMSSADVVRYLVAKYLAIEEEVHARQTELLCIDGAARYKGAENFMMFNLVEDMRDVVLQKHYLLVRADLQASGLFDLDAVLNDPPFTFVRSLQGNSQEVWGSIERITEQAEGQCAQPRHFGISINR